MPQLARHRGSADCNPTSATSASPAKIGNHRATLAGLRVARPGDPLAASLSGCILGIMGVAARSMDIDLTGATATVSKDMADTPRHIVHLAVTVRILSSFDDRQGRKLEAAAHPCPVHNAFAIAAPITFDWIG
ncbi:MAG: OsmC family protein [Sphingomonas taxi]